MQHRMPSGVCLSKSSWPATVMRCFCPKTFVLYIWNCRMASNHTSFGAHAALPLEQTSESVSFGTRTLGFGHTRVCRMVEDGRGKTERPGGDRRARPLFVRHAVQKNGVKQSRGRVKPSGRAHDVHRRGLADEHMVFSACSRTNLGSPLLATESCVANAYRLRCIRSTVEVGRVCLSPYVLLDDSRDPRRRVG